VIDLQFFTEIDGHIMPRWCCSFQSALKLKLICANAFALAFAQKYVSAKFSRFTV
jgi:hypothetical protein